MLTDFTLGLVDDILRARLTTTGVEEHRLVIEKGPDCGMEWIIYDVGGFRSQRAAWAPFFDSGTYLCVNVLKICPLWQGLGERENFL